MALRRRLIQAAFVFLAVMVVGIIGYLAIEPEYGLLDAVYMTVITLASVGYGEVHPLSHAGRIFTIFLIMGGTGTLLYGISTATAFVVEGELKDLLRRRRMEKRIAALNGHYIVCGMGGAGRYVAEELRRTRRPFVMVDHDPKDLESVPGDGEMAWLAGDATSGAMLRAAGIERAAGLVSALETDKDNVFVVLTARDLNPTMRIVALALDPESDHKLHVAGADEVVQPNKTGGMRVASVLIRPAVVTFLDTMLREQSQTLRVEEMLVAGGAPAEGRRIGDLAAIREAHALVVALRHGVSAWYQFNPPGDKVLAAGDTLILMVEAGGLEVLRRGFAAPDGAGATPSGEPRP